MGNAPSAAESASVPALLQSLLNGDLPTTSSLLLHHPGLLAAALDLDHGHTAMHIAVIAKQHTILSYMLSCATIGG